MLAALLGLSAAAAQERFSSGVQVVEVYATVTDERGEPVTGLPADAFTVLEDGESQTVTAFTAGDFPLNVALALDRSFSMAGERLEATRRAAHAFVDALRREDRVLIVRIGTNAELSTARAEQHASIDASDAWGTTALHDAIVDAIDAIERAGDARGRHALVLFSDGTDRYSRAGEADVLARARRANVLIYPVAVGRERPGLFAELASMTGGRSVHEREAKRLPDVARAIARELRFQYLLGYTPTRTPAQGAEEWRSITVRVDRPGLRVRARDGYVAR